MDLWTFRFFTTIFGHDLIVFDNWELFPYLPWIWKIAVVRVQKRYFQTSVGHFWSICGRLAQNRPRVDRFAVDRTVMRPNENLLEKSAFDKVLIIYTDRRASMVIPIPDFLNESFNCVISSVMSSENYGSWLAPLEISVISKSSIDVLWKSFTIHFLDHRKVYGTMFFFNFPDILFRSVYGYSNIDTLLWIGVMNLYYRSSIIKPIVQGKPTWIW